MSIEISDEHAKAVRLFDKAYSAQRDGRLLSIEDRRFVFIAGGMWEGSLADQFENRPRMEVNKVLMGLRRIDSEYRNNRITVQFRPSDQSSDDDISDVLEGLFRADEQQSNASEAYDNGFEEGAAGGIGAWRLRVDYEDECCDDDSDDKTIKIEPIFDADQSVFWDIDAKRYDKKDAKRCWVITSMDPDTYREKYDRNPVSFGNIQRTTFFDWFSPEVVYVAEYYVIEETKVVVKEYTSPDGVVESYEDWQFKEDEELAADLKALGWKETSSKKVKRRKCMKYLMDGASFLEDPIEIPGARIPIVMYYGTRRFIDNIERQSGYVRPTKDPQRLYNMQISMLAETAVFSPIEKPVVDPEQIKGLEHIWQDDNIMRYPYLPLKALRAADGSIVAQGIGSYTRSPQLPPALQGIIQAMDSDLKEVTGSAEQAEKMVSNVSADAISLIQSQVGLISFTYIDNFAKSMKCTGEIWRGMARHVYAKKGKKRVVNPDGSDSVEELMEATVDPKTGKPKMANDITRGSHQVIVDVGPSFTAKRDQTVKNLLNLLQVIGPQSPYFSVIIGMLFENMDGEGLKELKEYARKQLLTEGIVEPRTDEERQMLEQLRLQAQSQPPDAQSQALQSMAAESEAKAVKAQADTLKAMADAEKTKAETAQILANVDDAGMQKVLKLIQAMQQEEAHQGNMSQMQQTLGQAAQPDQQQMQSSQAI